MNATIEACLPKHSGAEVPAVQTLRDNGTIPGPREASGLSDLRSTAPEDERRGHRRFPGGEVTV